MLSIFMSKIRINTIVLYITFTGNKDVDCKILEAK